MEKETAKLELRIRAMLEVVNENLRGKIEARYSQVMQNVDAFMAQTMAVRTDHTFFIYRLDNYEARLKKIEQELEKLKM